VPNDQEKPFITSGIRLGTPAITTRGFKEEDMKTIAEILHQTLMNPKDEETLQKVKETVKILTSKYPLNY
jgi:glycine hydroxymethyltransferase